MTPPRPVAGDAVIAVAAAMISSGVKVAGVVAAPLLRTERWPRPLRELAATGFARRQEATAQVLRWYHAAAPVVVRDVLDHMDLPGLVRDVVEESDLPELIRLSTGSVATETVREFRIRTMTADEVVSGWVGRIFGRRPATAPATRPVTPVAG
ncbi:MAG TPA: hypothetical protein VJ870_14425 [Amycolatopsis sp.]|nr:hypothetical protein [Amycolatopsis sp.]